jgi:poly(A) polymerase
MFHPLSSPVKPAVRIAASEAVRVFHFSGRAETVTMKLDVDSTSRGMSIPRILPRAEHPISRGYIDPDALRVLYRLHRAGFKAYLVGGSVRDLMTGRTPKDFDVGTDARPQEIRRLFRNSRVIGRRFRLAHILFEGGKVVEVSTFRKTPDAVQGEQGQEGDDDLLIRSDNTFGSPEEDALRRDFTINGLFYDIATYAVLDFVGGVEDLERRVVRTIGNPLIRFREDPVRMLRACEFAARLSFEMSEDVRAAITELTREVTKSAAPRVTEELLDPLRRGWGHATFRLWSEAGLLDALLPELGGVGAARGAEGTAEGLLFALLREIDAKQSLGERLEEATLLSAMFLPVVFDAVRRQGPLAGPALILLVLEDTLNPLALRMALPNHLTQTVKHVLETLGRLTSTRPADPGSRRLAGRPYLKAAVALLSLYARASGRYREAAAAWEEAVEHGLGSQALAAPFPVAPAPPGAISHPAPGGQAPARKRRRGGRRRRPQASAAPA